MTMKIFSYQIYMAVTSKNLTNFKMCALIYQRDRNWIAPGWLSRKPYFRWVRYLFRLFICYHSGVLFCPPPLPVLSWTFFQVAGKTDFHRKAPTLLILSIYHFRFIILSICYLKQQKYQQTWQIKDSQPPQTLSKKSWWRKSRPLPP